MSTSFLIAEAWDEGFEAAIEWIGEVYGWYPARENQPINPYVND